MNPHNSIDFDVAYVAMQSYSAPKPEPELPTKEKRRTKVLTAGYRPRRYFNQPRDLPLFTFDTVRNMLYDSQVRLALAMRAAPIQQVEFAYVEGVGNDGKPNWVPGVQAKDPILEAWVLRQLHTIWSHHLSGLLRCQVWGWAAGEVTLKLSEQNLLEIACLYPRHSVDSRLLELDSTGDPWGVQFQNVEGEGIVQLPFPYSYFINFRPEDGEKYSAPILLGAYSPWADKWFDGGALDTRRLFMHKDAYGGMRIGYPEEDLFIEGREDVIPARDLAQQIAEQRANGGTVTYPTTKYGDGGEKWRIEEATVTSNPQHILQFPKDLDQEINRGMEIPDGAISNDGAGSWEGKSLPLAAFYSGLDSWVCQMLKDLRNTIEPLAVMNFGEAGREFVITHKPLSLQAMEQQGEKRSGPDGMGMGMGMDSMQQQPMMMSTRGAVDPVLAVGSGVMEAGAIVRAARMALDTTDHIKKKAELIAEILTNLFGDEAEAIFGDVFGEGVQRMRAWNPIEHPRGSDGRFIEKNSPEAVAAANERISETLKGKRTPSGLRTVTEHLSILTVSQLRDVMREHNVKASGVKPSLVDKIAARLMGSINQTDEEADDNRPDGTPKKPSPRNVYTVPTDSLNIDPSRFQYKVKGIDASGVTEELKGSSKWNPELAGALLVWRDPKDGQDYVVNGHHRHHLAKRLGADELNVRYIDADNARTARSKGALANIAEGRGTSVDAAKYLRDSDQDVDHLEKAGISLSGRVASEAGVLKHLADKPFQMVTEGRLDEQKALAVAKHLKDHNLQNKLFKKLEAREEDGKEWTNREIETAAKKMANAGKVTQTGFDLFGSWEDEQDTFDQEVEIEAYVSRLLQQEANDFRAVANQRRADRVADAGNTLAVDENARRAQSATALFEDFEMQAKRRGQVADAIKYWAGELLGAKNRKQRDQIKTDALQSIRDVLQGKAKSNYSDTEKYHKIIDEVTSLPPDLIQVTLPGEVQSVPDEVARNMRFDEPIQVSVYADGTVSVQDGHHRLAAAKQLGMTQIPVTLQAINAKGSKINELIAASAESPALVTMSARRAPSGYSKDNPLVINGQEYFGGQFIPGEQLKHATAEQMAEIESGKRSATVTDIVPQPDGGKKNSEKLEAGPNHQKHAQTLTNLRQIKLKNGHQIKIGYDPAKATNGYYVRHYAPGKERQDYATRFDTVAEAADYGAKILHAKGRATREASQPTAKITTPTKPIAPRQTLKGDGNWRYKSTDFFSSGTKSKFKDNINALRTVKTLELENRKPTKEEQETISKWVGWGQMPQLFGYQSNDRDSITAYYEWRKESQLLKGLLSESEYKAARASTINGHYTHPSVIQAHWKMAEKLGYKGGRMLEPAVGSGYYLGFMPDNLADNTHVTAVEMDPGSAAIAKALYPDADVHTSPFQHFRTPKDYFDLVATNVPFSNEVQIYSPKHKMTAALHDYYFLRSVETAKPGALIMQITSAGTMDKMNSLVREYLNRETELVSAIRFPGDTHKENAGTEVVTDMLILRKRNKAIPETTAEVPTEAIPSRIGFTGTTVDSLGRLYHWVDGERVPAPKWDDTVEVEDPNGGAPIRVNKYFADRPDNILGVLDRSGKMYAGGMKNVQRTENYDEQLQQIIEDLPENIVRTNVQDTAPKNDNRVITDDQSLHQGQYVLKEGVVYQHDSGALAPVKLSAKDKPIVLSLVGIKDAAREVIAKQHQGLDSTAEQAKLNELYDSFVDKYGPIHSAKNRKAISGDTDIAFLLALENYNSTTKQADKADLFSKVTIRPNTRASSARDIGEATGIVLHENGGINVDRISELLGKSREEVEESLVSSHLAFRTPQGKWEPAAIYLSGNTRQKLLDAQAAAKEDPAYLANVRALENAQPEDIETDDIGVTIGSPWIPEKYLSQFASELLGASPEDVVVKFQKETGHYTVDITNSYIASRRATTEIWGDFEKVMQSALTNKSVQIYRDEPGGGRVLDQVATRDFQEKVDRLKEQFKDWVWEDPQRAQELAEHYNKNYNNYVETEYDGSHQTFPGMKKGFELRKLQKDFVYRVVATGKGLAAHEVGTGKTASMVAAAMELRRLGLAKKPAISVKKANIEQFAAEAQDLYPGARILTLGKNFTGDERIKTLQRIATGDYDMIILTHENMQGMRMRPETMERFVSEDIQELEAALSDAKAREREEALKGGRKKRGKSDVKAIEARLQKQQAYLDKILKQDDKDAIFFEDTGIDQLFVDEAHKFKSLPVVTANSRVKGIPTLDSSSIRAMDMLARCRYLQDKNNGRGVVFATGTPITNTMAELFNMQRFLQYNELQERGIHRFDTWAATFGELTNDLEYKLNGDVSATQRFAKFINLPELKHLCSDFMDVKLAENVEGLKRPKKHDHVVVVKPTTAMDDLMSDIRARAEDVKKRPDSRKQRLNAKGEMVPDSALMVYTDARKASLDLRLYDSALPDLPDSKVNRAIDNVLKIYREDKDFTQAIFSDMGIHDSNKSGFSLFADIKKKLVSAGIPEQEIVDFSDSALTDEKREAAQAAMRRGDVRIALGSTERLGTGTNIQTRLKAIHHLDIPMVPSALEQRDGRAYRQKNMHSDIDVYRYIQEESADHISWQLLAKKSGFINQFMRGDKRMRTMEDLATDDLTPEQMIAVALGDSAMLRRMGVEEEVKRLERAEKKHEQRQLLVQARLGGADRGREEYKKAIEARRQDAEHFAKYEDFSFKDIRGQQLDRKEAASHLAQQIVESAQTTNRWTPTKIGLYKDMPVYHFPQNDKTYFVTPSGLNVYFGHTLASLESLARRAENRYKEAVTGLEEYDADLKQLEKSKGEKFRHAELLKQRKEELARLIAESEQEIKKMGLQVGSRRVVNGTEYVLNENHRWTLPDSGQITAPKPPKQQQTATRTPTDNYRQPSIQKAKKAMPKARPVTAAQQVDSQIVQLAGQEGDSEQHRQARKVVSMHYLQNVAKSYDHKTGSMVPLSDTQIFGMLEGIDLSQPVTLGPPPRIPPPDKLVQWQANGGYRGSYFSTPDHEPEQLGIHRQAKAWTLPGQPVLPRRKTVYSTKNAKLDRISYLHSTAAPTVDTWSVPGESFAVSGGGLQWYIPVAAHPGVRVAKTNEQ